MIVECDNLFGIVVDQNVHWMDKSITPHDPYYHQVMPRTECYSEFGVECREETPPIGWVVVDTFIPHTTPWDYQGNKWAMEKRDALLSKGIPALICNIHERSLSPRGSGPGGRVRFGDDMLPGVYRVAVPNQMQEQALNALREHKEAIDKWINEGGPRP